MNNELARLVGDYLKSEDGRVDRRDIWKRAFMGFCIGCALALIMLALPGCASVAQKEDDVWQRICYVKPLGNTEDGMIVIAQACLTPEQFEARNRR